MCPQVFVALEAAEDPANHLTAAQDALKHALAAEEYFIEAQRTVRCFDNAAFLLEQAEARVKEAESAMKVATLPAASRMVFEQALERYEDSLSVAASSDGGADTFQEACNNAFFAAREVEIVARRARRQVRTLAERRRRELARLDRPAAALVALDLAELTVATGQVPRRAVAAVRDALSAINSAREEVVEWRGEGEDGAVEAALAERVEQAVQAAVAADRAFREARDRARKAERWRQELSRPQADLARVEEEVMAAADAELILELCSSSVGEARAALRAAREAVAAVGGGGKGAINAEALVEASRAKVNFAQRDASEQASARCFRHRLARGSARGADGSLGTWYIVKTSSLLWMCAYPRLSPQAPSSDKTNMPTFSGESIIWSLF